MFISSKTCSGCNGITNILHVNTDSGCKKTLYTFSNGTASILVFRNFNELGPNIPAV